jgi:phenylpropionate dioxygenase-like ring-hydroxylating dioxygenase large terminal subunit
MSPATARALNEGPALGASAMPAWVYQHPGMMRLELERLLRPSWQVACHVNSIPKAGDYVTLRIGGDSIIVVRDRDGQVRAFHNACRHRGTLLLDGDGNCGGAITCPYHGWTYRHDGSLSGVAVRESYPGLDRSKLGLKPVRTDTAMGLVFVCLAGDPPPPSRLLAPFLEELAPYRFEEMVPLGPITTEIWECDWKLAMDNYLESYHVPIGHPGLARMFTPDFEDQVGDNILARGNSWLRDTPSTKWSERMYQRMVGEVATHLPADYRRCWRFYSMLPNLGIDVMPEQFDFFQLLPLSPGRTLVRGAYYGLPDDRREMRVLRGLGNRINEQVNAEDKWLCERVQRGLASSTYEPGPLSTIESWMYEFHEVLRERIPETRSATPPPSLA